MSTINPSWPFLVTATRLKAWTTASHRAYCARLLVLCLSLAVGNQKALSVVTGTYLCDASNQSGFPLVSESSAAALWLCPQADAGLHRVVKLFQADIARVTGETPAIAQSAAPQSRFSVIIGTLGECPLIDRLAEDGKLDVSAVAGRWEASVIQVIDEPSPGIHKALVVAGSDKRGTMYALFDLSEQMGVSPWYWWADVPVPHRDELHIAPGPFFRKEPAVKYRGIFINDEAPALANWAQEKFGGCNHKFYDHVFQLILRLKGNYLWPAMWGRSIYDDDPQSPVLANEYGIVIGTSHHEPMMRAHVEWQRYGKGPWNYQENKAVLQDFWRQGIQRMGANESIVTVGMRGDGDEPMSEEANIELLQQIVADQRGIIAEVTGKPVETVPQMWALYKEVQEYYDRGMRVPEDITLLLCDDNWGNIRKLPKPTDKARAGGYGLYYHFDYVGSPRNYKWINTNPLPRIWEQMNLAYQHGVEELWIVNVGDIKPMEVPTEFFLDMAWEPEKWSADRLQQYTTEWASRDFGKKHAPDIAKLLNRYLKFNARRKPELLDADTYSLIHFREAETVVQQYQALATEAEAIASELPKSQQDAFFQFVLHPILASSNLYELYYTVAKNRLYAEQGRASTNHLAEQASSLYQRDAEITNRYHSLNDGKWNHMMSQIHIGYTYWQQPEVQAMPEVKSIEPKANAEAGLSIEGRRRCWPDSQEPATLPELAPYGASKYLEIFNRGKQAFSYEVKASESWLKVSPQSGTVNQQTRVDVSVDWQLLPETITQVTFQVSTSTGQVFDVTLPINQIGLRSQSHGAFIENNGYVSILADHFARTVSAGELTWRKIPDLGRTGSAMTPQPVTAPRVSHPQAGPRLEYDVLLKNQGEVGVMVYASPTLDYYARDGLRYAVSIDDASPQIVNIHSDQSDWRWQQHVGRNINVSVSTHTTNKPGKHTVKLWMIDPGVVVQKLVLGTAELPESYLGPPESPRVP